HRPATAAQRRALLDRFGPGTHLFIREQRHRRNGVWPMTMLATPLQNRSDIFREGDLVGLRPDGTQGYGHPGGESHNHSSNNFQSSHVPSHSETTLVIILEERSIATLKFCRAGELAAPIASIMD